MKRLIIPLLLVTATAACAPMGGRGPGEDGTDGGPGGGRGMMERGGGANSVVADLQERLSRTADALKLNPTQLPLWDAYQERISALMADQMKLEPYRAKQGALQAIGQKVDTVRNRLTAMEDIQDAAGKLYATLDDRQKQTADQLLPPTVPALYSGLGASTGGNGGERSGGRNDRQGGPGGGGMNGPGGGMGGGGMGGGFGRF